MYLVASMVDWQVRATGLPRVPQRCYSVPVFCAV